MKESIGGTFPRGGTVGIRKTNVVGIKVGCKLVNCVLLVRVIEPCTGKCEGLLLSLIMSGNSPILDYLVAEA